MLCDVQKVDRRRARRDDLTTRSGACRVPTSSVVMRKFFICFYLFPLMPITAAVITCHEQFFFMCFFKLSMCRSAGSCSGGGSHDNCLTSRLPQSSPKRQDSSCCCRGRPRPCGADILFGLGKTPIPSTQPERYEKKGIYTLSGLGIAANKQPRKYERQMDETYDDTGYTEQQSRNHATGRKTNKHAIIGYLSRDIEKTKNETQPWKPLFKRCAPPPPTPPSRTDITPYRSPHQNSNLQ